MPTETKIEFSGWMCGMLIIFLFVLCGLFSLVLQAINLNTEAVREQTRNQSGMNLKGWNCTIAKTIN